MNTDRPTWEADEGSINGKRLRESIASLGSIGDATRLRAERDELRERLAGDRLQIEGLVNRREGFADIEIGAAYLKGKADALGVALSYLDEYVSG